MPSNKQIIEKFKEAIMKEEAARLNTLLRLCESEIEALFLINAYKWFHDTSLSLYTLEYIADWVEMDKKETVYFNYIDKGALIHLHIKGFIAKGGNESYQVIPQFPIDNGKFRIDIAIIYEVEYLSGKKKGQIVKKMFAIECDGFDYHSSKEQLSNDNQKAIRLLEKGWIVLRYTGTYINKLQNERDFHKVLNSLEKITLNT